MILSNMYGYISIRYAMKCLDKKRIKMKQGETLALNERIMLSHVRMDFLVHVHEANTSLQLGKMCCFCDLK